MSVEVNTYEQIRDVVGQKSFTIEVDPGDTIADAMQKIAEKYPEIEVADSPDDDPLTVMVNGQHLKYLQGDETPIEDGDRISLSGEPMRD